MYPHTVFYKFIKHYDHEVDLIVAMDILFDTFDTMDFHFPDNFEFLDYYYANEKDFTVWFRNKEDAIQFKLSVPQLY